MSRVRPLVLPAGSLTLGRIELPEDVARHVRDVLRLRADAPVRVTDGTGRWASGRVLAVQRRQVSVQLDTIDPQVTPAGPNVTLMQGVGKGDKLDAVVRQAVELGVRAVQPVLTARTVPRAGTRPVRLQAIAEDAMRVSGRAWRPTILAARDLQEVLREPRSGSAFVLAWGGEASLAQGLRRLPPVEAVTLLVGPEGGLTNEEVDQAQAAGFALAHLGPHTLRTETAGPAVVAVTMAFLGAWDGG